MSTRDRRPRKRHAEQRRLEAPALGDRRLHVAHGDVADADAIEGDGGDARDAVGGGDATA